METIMNYEVSLSGFFSIAIGTCNALLVTGLINNYVGKL
jgi:hypothetical protein